MLFTTTCFVGFYSVPNLIVIIFNLLYPVCIMGFHCKGYMIEGVVWRLKHLKIEEDFADISRLSIPRSILCALHVLEYEESSQMETVVSREYLSGPARHSRGILFCQLVQSVWEKLAFHIPNTHRYKHPLYPRIVESFQREFWKRNPREK